jgi:TRAP-type mannitol/chloroaromatic compound transport system permease small subunit
MQSSPSSEPPLPSPARSRGSRPIVRGPLGAFVASIDALDRWIAGAASWLLLAMVLIGAGNALARTFEGSLGFRLSSNALLEAQWYLFGLVFLLAAPDALRRGAHVRVDVLYAGQGRHADAPGSTFGSGVLLLLPFCVFGDLVEHRLRPRLDREFETSSDPGGLWRWPLKPVIPLAFGLLFLQGCANAVRSWVTLGARRRQPQRGTRMIDGREFGSRSSSCCRLRRRSCARARIEPGLGGLMFATAFALIFLGYPVAFVLGGVAVLFGAIGVWGGYFDQSLLTAFPAARVRRHEQPGAARSPVLRVHGHGARAFAARRRPAAHDRPRVRPRTRAVWRWPSCSSARCSRPRPASSALRSWRWG